MIVIKELRWSNAFSYGKNNVINFCENPLTQLVGKNGYGKSSIPLILEEGLFNKNSKGIKKGDILNRYTKDKAYSIEIDFSKDGREYQIKSTRSSTQTVKLIRDGIDISAHTATATYKIIEDILGIDHKTFTQIVYQSNASSLEFLTAPDTARKKFLIEILNLGVYTSAAEIFKKVADDLNKEIIKVQTQVNTLGSWINKYANTDLTYREVLPSIAPPEDLTIEYSQLSNSLKSIDATNRKITQNNTYKKIQSGLKLFPIPEQPVDTTATLTANSINYTTELNEHNKSVKDSIAFVKKIEGLKGMCPTCLQPIDEEKLAYLIAEQKQLQRDTQVQITSLNNTISLLNAEKAKATKNKEAWSSAIAMKEEWEKYHQLIDDTMSEDLLDKNDIANKLDILEREIAEAKSRITIVERLNKEATIHNASVDVISKQLTEYNEQLEAHSASLHSLSERMVTLNLLNKAFSTTGLVAYKIEGLVKDLEELTNHYLVDLSDGRFQLAFKISSSDKLNVVITDNGRDIDILALSGGERARVNVATLLAIRKLMQSLSSSRINLLILDETIEALDVDGKERLVEVLLSEEYLNTFLVSHGFQHPLLEKVNVIKTNNISSIER